jgi:PAS domain-containing protein
MKSRLPRLLGGLPDGMVIVDEQGRILQANAQAVSLFGVGVGQLNGTPVQALFPVSPFLPPAGARDGETRPTATPNSKAAAAAPVGSEPPSPLCP